MHKFNTHFYIIHYLIIFTLIGFSSSFLYASPDLEKLNVPDGFEISIYADELDSPRQLAETNEGYIVVGSKKGDKIFALYDSNFDGYAEKRILISDNLQNPTGVTVHDGNLYFAEIDTIWVIEDIDKWLNSNSKSLPNKSIYMNNLPSETWHGFKYIDFGPDDNLYIPVGVPCNICLEPQTKDTRFAAIHKYVDGELITVADGVRNSVGFDWHPVTKELYFTDNGRDWMGDDIPPCELNKVEFEGEHFGFPYIHGNDIEDDGFKSPKGFEFSKPIWEFQAHTAPIGMKFYDGSMFPDYYRNGIFVAQHGSWNRSSKVGYKVLFMKIKDGLIESSEVFLDGWLEGESTWGAPAAPLVLRDGSMLISDDRSNQIFRITYKNTKN